MREYKFRGKRIDNGEWVYGFGVHFIDGYKVAALYSARSAAVAVDPETVGQYTGAKDIVGKEIFENDIADHTIASSDKTLRGLVSVHPSQGVKVGSWPLGFDCRVVGNAFDTPHLLEQGEKT